MNTFGLDENVSVPCFGRRGAEDPASVDRGCSPLFTDTGRTCGHKTQCPSRRVPSRLEAVDSPDPGHNPDHSFYYVMRGYWDDWWMRLRNQAGSRINRSTLRHYPDAAMWR